MSADSSSYQSTLRHWQRRAFLAGGVAAAICAVAAFFLPDQFFRAYLAAYMFWLGVSLGSLAILMLYHLTGGAWGYLIRRILEAQMSTLPLMAVLFIPIGFGLSELYLWAQPEIYHQYKAIRESRFYLNESFFLIRAPLYFGVWLLFMLLLKRLTRKQAESGDPSLPNRFQRTSEIGLVLFGTAMHFAVFDWVQTLQSHFHSTIFPLLVAASQLLSAQTFAVFVFGMLTTKFRASELASTSALVDLGNLILTFLIITSYLMWFQYMLVWMANLSYGSMWYLPRIRGGWGGVIIALMALQFAIPLLLLLQKSIKSNPKWLATLAGTMFVLQAVLTYWLIVPAFPGVSMLEHWMDFVTPIAIGGLNLGLFLGQLLKYELVVPNDPNRKRAMELYEIDRETLERREALAHG